VCFCVSLGVVKCEKVLTCQCLFFVFFSFLFTVCLSVIAKNRILTLEDLLKEKKEFRKGKTLYFTFC